jgi:polysaccharide export outer membrane protein
VAVANKTMERRSSGRLAALCFATLFAAMSATAETPAGGEVAAPPSPSFAGGASYLLQPGDVVEISVWKEEDLKKELLVRPDGGLSFPLAGDLKVAGHTTVEVEHEIEARLAKFFADVTVNVAVLQINGNQVYVLGKVNKPGVYKFDRAVDVMQALSLAGGTTEFADVNDIRIIRRGPDGRQTVLAFAYSDVARGRRLEQNIVLQSGDTLVVP